MICEQPVCVINFYPIVYVAFNTFSGVAGKSMFTCLLVTPWSFQTSAIAYRKAYRQTTLIVTAGSPVAELFRNNN